MEPEQHLGHSTLEVDVRAQKEHEKRIAAANGLDGGPLETIHGGEGNLPQVQYSQLPQHVDNNFPEAMSNDPPEAVPPAEVPLAGKSAREGPTICGLRRKTFWIGLAVILLVVIGAAVGGGVGGALANKTTSTSSTPGSSSGGGGSSSDSTALLSNTKLATLNYTDVNGIENFHVFYQVESNAIYRSAWNSSSKVWIVSNVTTDTNNIKKRTPISADVAWHSTSHRNFQVYWLDPDNGIRGLISNDVDGGDKPSAWVNSAIDGRYTAASTSQLISYGRECDDCLDANIVIYEDSRNNLQFCTHGSPAGDQPAGWSQTQFPAGTPAPVNGSSLAMKPVYTSGTTKYLVLFINSAYPGTLTQMVYNDTSDGWTSETLQTSLAKRSSIAAFTAGYNDTANDTLNIQVLTTFPNSTSGGVTRNTFSGNAWAAPELESALQDIASSSAVAANQAGHVYGILLASDGTPQLTEWMWQDGGYVEIGLVNTNVN